VRKYFNELKERVLFFLRKEEEVMYYIVLILLLLSMAGIVVIEAIQILSAIFVFLILIKIDGTL
jgi:hypothetical protein